MVVPPVGAVVLVSFSFSNLSQAKLRPAVVLADGGRGDWILCQITSNPYGDPLSVSISSDGFASGSLRVVSYARCGKLFTASQDLMLSKVATLNQSQLTTIVEMVLDILRNSTAQPVD